MRCDEDASSGEACEALPSNASCRDSVDEEMRCDACVVLALTSGRGLRGSQNGIPSLCKALRVAGQRGRAEASNVHEMALSRCVALVSCPGCRWSQDAWVFSCKTLRRDALSCVADFTQLQEGVHSAQRSVGPAGGSGPTSLEAQQLIPGQVLIKETGGALSYL